MNLGELRIELGDRGYDDLSDARLNRFINQAYMEITERYAWPFLEKTVPVAPDATIDDVRTILTVQTAEGYNLTHMERPQLAWNFGDLSYPGTPSYFYRDGNVLKVYPTSADNVNVRYLYVPDLLVDDADIPVIPTQYHELIIDGAVLRGLKDSDNYEGMGALRQEFERSLNSMAMSLLPANNYVLNVVDHW